MDASSRDFSKNFLPADQPECKFSNAPGWTILNVQNLKYGFQKFIIPGKPRAVIPCDRKTFGGPMLLETNGKLFLKFLRFCCFPVQILKSFENLHFWGFENLQHPGRPSEWFRWFLVAGFRFRLRREVRWATGSGPGTPVWRFLRFARDFRWGCKFSNVRI